jgi:hypothetical protein
MSDQAKSGVVQLFERSVRDGVPVVEVQVDIGGGRLLTVDHEDSSGLDCPPLAGDYAAISEATGSGAARSAGYTDPKNAGEALGGEHRAYARTPDGPVAGFMWIHGDGLIDIQGLVAGHRYRIGKVLIDAEGNITTPGDITVKSAGASVTLSTHKHGSGTGPTTPPTPGT